MSSGGGAGREPGREKRHDTCIPISTHTAPNPSPPPSSPNLLVQRGLHAVPSTQRHPTGRRRGEGIGGGGWGGWRIGGIPCSQGDAGVEHSLGVTGVSPPGWQCGGDNTSFGGLHGAGGLTRFPQLAPPPRAGNPGPDAPGTQPEHEAPALRKGTKIAPPTAQNPGRPCLVTPVLVGDRLGWGSGALGG